VHNFSGSDAHFERLRCTISCGIFNKITNNKIQQYLNENRINNKENMTYEERIELANILLKLNFLTYCQVSYLSGLKYYEIINMSKVSERK